MSAQRAPATQPAKARKPVKHFHFGTNNVFDRIQKDLQQAEEKTRRTRKSIPRGVDEWN